MLGCHEQPQTQNDRDQQMEMRCGKPEVMSVTREGGCGSRNGGLTLVKEGGAKETRR
jgi:hypothetical protein